MKSILVAAASAAAMLAAAGVANAAVLEFNEPVFPYFISTAFADGTLSHGLSDKHQDGFVAFDTTLALNAWGQNGEYISFNAPVTLNSLKLAPCDFCVARASLYTVNLFNAASVLVGSQSITGSSTEETLTFDTPNVSKVEFDFVGGLDYDHDGINRAWYIVRDITYTLGGGGAVPEPAVWALMIGGFGMAGVALRRRKAAQA